MTFQELKTLAWTRIPRLDSTNVLYDLEEQASAAIGNAASELEQFFASPLADRRITRDEALTLELVTLLETYGRSGAVAARIIVDRYGIEG